MKLLKKIRLINWHYFWNETIDVEPIVFLTGVNGSGKSTLIDAIEVILLGDTSGRSFNKAAMDKSSRTLRGYLRGEIGDDLDNNGFKYLRNGRFTSYIVLEFNDDVNKSDFCMGIVFDSFEDGSEEHHFFILEDKIPSNNFVSNNIPLDYKDLSKFFSENYNQKFNFFDSNKQYQTFLKRKFGGLKDKYFSLLKKSTSFSPITDITSFITEYVCDPQQNIELSHLQENILNYKRLEIEAENISKRVERLEEIKNLHNIYTSHQKNLKISQYIIEKCEISQNYDKLNTYKNELYNAKQRINEIDLSIAEFSGNLAELEKRRINLIQDKANNDTLRLTDELIEEKNKAQQKINQILANSEDIKNNINRYCNHYYDVTKKLIDELNNFNTEFLDEDKERELTELLDKAKSVNTLVINYKVDDLEKLKSINKDDLEKFKEELNNFKSLIANLSVSISRTIHNFEKKITSLREEEKNIKQGSKTYDSRLKEIKEELEERLFNKFNKHIRVDFYADLIDINNLAWSNAIEGFLYGQKFNLFVEPKYFLDAYNILKNLLLQYKYYHTSLVDQERIIEKNYSCEPHSLAEEISTKHEGARAYTNYLIGRLYKANNIEEARNSQNGITKDCDLYRSFSLQKINPKLYQLSFIGSTLDQRFLEEKSYELKDNIANLNLYKSLKEIIADANNLENINSNEIAAIFKVIETMSQIKGLENSIAYYDEQLKDHDTTLILSIDKRLNDVEIDIKNLNSDKDNLILEKGNLIKEIENIENEKIVNVNLVIKEKENNLNTNYSSFLIEDEANKLYQEEIEKGLKILEILQEYQIKLAKLQYLITNLNNQIVKLRRDYINDYHLSYNASDESNKEFDQELIDFKEVQLPAYTLKIKDSYEKATQQFKDDFIFKLRNAIEEVEDQIENLNLALVKSQFGKDLYKFTVKPSQVYRRYYDMLKDDLILTSDQNDTEFIEKYKDVMEDLFKQIVQINSSGDKTSELMSNIEKFTDYRNYLDFDLIVYNIDSKTEQRLSKMIKKKSGGETQTPFYISVLASFAQLYHVHEDGEFSNTSRIIIFDEAFSKMDRSRIKEAVRLLRKFNLQVILSAPSDKVGDISALADQTLVTLHDKNSSCVREYQQIK
ncbi:MAG: ATP-binding protein [Bacillales bacterium]